MSERLTDRTLTVTGTPGSGEQLGAEGRPRGRIQFRVGLNGGAIDTMARAVSWLSWSRVARHYLTRLETTSTGQIQNSTVLSILIS